MWKKDKVDDMKRVYAEAFVERTESVKLPRWVVQKLRSESERCGCWMQKILTDAVVEYLKKETK